MQLSLLENQPIHGLRSLFVATGIVLFVGLCLDWPHSPSWYVVTVAPFLLIFIAAMGLGRRWHCTAWYVLGRAWPAGRAGDALRGLLEYRLSGSLRLQLRPRAHSSAAATLDTALAQAAQTLDSTARALPATLRRSAVLTALDVIQAETQVADDVPRLTRRLAEDMLTTGVRSRLHLPPGSSPLRLLLDPHRIGFLLALVAAGSITAVVGASAAVGPGPVLLFLLLGLLAMAGAALWLVGTLTERR